MEMEPFIDFRAPFLWITKAKYHNVPVRFEITHHGKKLTILHLTKRVSDSWFLNKIKITKSSNGAGGVTGSVQADGFDVQFLHEKSVENQVLGWLRHHIDEYFKSKSNSPPGVQQNQESAAKSNSKATFNVPPPLPPQKYVGKKAVMRAPSLQLAQKSPGSVSRFPSDKPAVPIESPDKRRRETYTQSPLKEPRQSSFSQLQQDHPPRSQDDSSSPTPGAKRKRESTPSGLTAINRIGKLSAHDDDEENSNHNGRFDSPPQQRNHKERIDAVIASGNRGTRDANACTNRYVDPRFTNASAKVHKLFNNELDLKAASQAAVVKLNLAKALNTPLSTQPTESTRFNENGTPVRAATPANGGFQRHSSIFKQPLNTYGNSDRSNGMLKRSTNAFSSYGISFKDYDSNKPQYAGGVKNLGNTCYMGSVLQALFNLHPRYHHVLNGALQAMVDKISSAADCESAMPKGVLQPLHHLLTIHSEKRNHLISSDSLSGMKSSATFSVQDSFFASVVKLEKQHSLDPLALKLAIARRANKYRDNSQQDAQEFLTDLMNELEDEILRIWQPTVPQLSLLTNHGSESSQSDKAIAAPGSVDAPAIATDDATNVEVIDTDEQQKQQQQQQQQPHLSTPSPVTITNVPRTEVTGEPIKETKEKGEEATVNGIDVMDISEDSAQQSAVEDETLRIKQLMHKVLPTTFLLESLMQVQMTCQQCGHHHEPKLEAYRDFAIDLQQQQIIAEEETSNNTVGIAGRSLRSTTTSRRPQDLHHLLRGFLQPELRDLHCPQCAADHSQVRISKQMVDLAPVLVLQLKRFQYYRNLQQFKKVDTEVLIPKILDLVNCGWQAVTIDREQVNGHALGGCSKASEECQKMFDKVWSQDCGSPQWMEAANQLQQLTAHGREYGQGDYRLAAVVRHSGASVGLGHYICDVQTVINNQSKWLRYNDSYVVEVEEDVVLGSATKDSSPYLLFYQFIPKSVL